MKTEKIEPRAVAQLLAQLLGENEQPEQDSILARAEQAPAPNVGHSKPTRWTEPVRAALSLMNRKTAPYTRAEAQRWVRDELGLDDREHVLLQRAVGYQLAKTEARSEGQSAKLS